MSTFTAESVNLTAGYDTTSDPRTVLTAAQHLVAFRDGLAGALLDLAEVTADLSNDAAACRLARLCAVLGPDEAYRRGVRITGIAGAVWGIFADIGAEKAHALATLRAVCHDTATAVRDELHRDSCLCIGGEKGALRARNEKGTRA